MKRRIRPRRRRSDLVPTLPRRPYLRLPPRVRRTNGYGRSEACCRGGGAWLATEAGVAVALQLRDAEGAEAEIVVAQPSDERHLLGEALATRIAAALGRPLGAPATFKHRGVAQVVSVMGHSPGESPHQPSPRALLRRIR